MICNHNWIKSEKNPSIGKEWVVENGEKKEKYYHVYKCDICGEEKQMSEEEAKSSKFDANTLNDIIIKAVESDPFWSIKINEFLNSLNGISYDDKVLFMIKLINDKKKFNKFTKELINSKNSEDLYNKFVEK